MAIVSITIVENPEQLLSGFPKNVSLSTNIPATIFYTLDGEAPTTSSNIYVSPIEIPVNQTSVTLKIFATNGMDSSAIITKFYTVNILHNTRLPHSPTTDVGTGTQSNFPFGNNLNNKGIQYLNPALAPITIADPTKPIIPAGYDANGNPAGGTNQSPDVYLNIYSATDSEGRMSKNIGTLPSQTKVIGRRYPDEYSVEESSRANKLFNPKARIRFQSDNDDPSNPVIINRAYYSDENLEVVNSGSHLKVTALESLGTTGSYIKSYYNGRTGMYTSYYRDSMTNKWIISSSKFSFKEGQNDLSGMLRMKGEMGVGRVMKWLLWQYRTLI